MKKSDFITISAEFYLNHLMTEKTMPSMIQNLKISTNKAALNYLTLLRTSVQIYHCVIVGKIKKYHLNTDHFYPISDDRGR